MALPSDVQAAVDAAIASAQASVTEAVDALTTGAQRMLAAAAALKGQPNEHPILDEVINAVTSADAALSAQLDTAVSNFRAASLVLADALPAAPTPA